MESYNLLKHWPFGFVPNYAPFHLLQVSIKASSYLTWERDILFLASERSDHCMLLLLACMLYRIESQAQRRRNVNCLQSPYIYFVIIFLFIFILTGYFLLTYLILLKKYTTISNTVNSFSPWERKSFVFMAPFKLPFVTGFSPLFCTFAIKGTFKSNVQVALTDHPGFAIL